LALTPTLFAQTVADEVRPLLESRCIRCHHDGNALGGLSLQSREAALRGGPSGPAVEPGNLKGSLFLARMELPADAAGLMPPGGPKPTEAELNLLRRWILQGAPWPDSLQAAAAGGEDEDAERRLVGRIHQRIVSGGKPPQPAEMKPYTQKIPGAEVSFTMIPIPGGEFVMGTPEDEPARGEDEGPQRRVRVSPFWMGQFEVTWDEYRLFMLRASRGSSDGDDLVDAVTSPTPPYVEMSFGMGINGFPAISMTQHAANKYAEWLSAKTGQFYRLPTEAEWEYACRAGTTTAYSFGGKPEALKEYGWYWDNSDGRYHEVGKKKANPWSLYDMHGNVWEWTLDQYLPRYELPGVADVISDPWVTATRVYPHVVRGGSWADDPEMARCGARRASDPSWKRQDPQLPKSIWYFTDAQWLGLRLVRPLQVPSAEKMYEYWNGALLGE
jgi:formylglycine-generating enzyme required for sulfatase activity